MPQSLSISNPPSGPVKRQRSSQELANNAAAGSSSLSASRSSNESAGESANSSRQNLIKVPAYLDKDRAKITAAFADIGWKERFRLQDALTNESSPFRLDRSVAVISRNRYGNVQPWDSSRIRLRKPIGGSDYVNASPIRLSDRLIQDKIRKGHSPSRGHENNSPDGSSDAVYRYIATQGPKEGQFSHFWHMVLQETTGDVGAIVMLTQLYEGAKEKCAQYFPWDMQNPTLKLPAHEESEESKEDAAGDSASDGDPFFDSPEVSADTDSLGTDSGSADSNPQKDDADGVEGQCGTVTLLSINYDAKIGCEVRQLQLTIGDESKVIYHYLFNGWPDFGKPEAEDRRALLELTKISKRVAGDSPRVVHCSAGVGRTGTWIALDFLLHELDSGRLLEAPSDYITAKPAPKSNGTWGRSGPPKPTTPDFVEEADLIWETVNTLREQRMMMVMNEVQYSFLYEVLKDAFIEKYGAKETGPVVSEAQEPSPKVARKKSPFGGMFEGTRVGKVKSVEDTVSEGGGTSDAETEILEKERKEADAEAEAEAEDPYAAVAPEKIREGQMKQEQNDVKEHEVQ
ncbi:tyrosine protein phosphatase 1 [Knufia peltigerae]|uniref:Tyrosine protein phosphatase 1 n=1 Tax=Knufia peltigerae TaxID=1002370 RepID=A0AA39CU55_9EURO|nr:tyrosine protein phosphatase 1 [Knufia peltigerae]